MNKTFTREFSYRLLFGAPMVFTASRDNLSIGRGRCVTGAMHVDQAAQYPLEGVQR